MMSAMMICLIHLPPLEQIGLLHGVMSDKEYNVIRDCLYMNLCEEPRLPKSFRGGSSSSEDTMRLLVDKVNMNSQMLLSRTVTIVAVEVNYALLELCNGIDEESPLAHVAVSTKIYFFYSFPFPINVHFLLSCQLLVLSLVRVYFGYSSLGSSLCIYYTIYMTPVCCCASPCSWSGCGCHIE